jgi:hypothetical protein
MRKFSISARLSLIAILLGAVSVAAVAQMPTSAAKPPKAASKAAKQEATPAARHDGPLLPSSFAGWQAASAAKSVTDPTQADSANAGALKEYGFTDALMDDYTRGSETLKIHALRFGDASGAYGAYSFYRQTGWPKEKSAPAEPRTITAFSSG